MTKDKTGPEIDPITRRLFAAEAGEAEAVEIAPETERLHAAEVAESDAKPHKITRAEFHSAVLAALSSGDTPEEIEAYKADELNLLREATDTSLDLETRARAVGELAGLAAYGGRLYNQHEIITGVLGLIPTEKSFAEGDWAKNPLAIAIQKFGDALGARRPTYPRFVDHATAQCIHRKTAAPKLPGTEPV